MLLQGMMDVGSTLVRLMQQRSAVEHELMKLRQQQQGQDSEQRAADDDDDKVITVRGSDGGRLCFRRSLFSVPKITHELLHLAR